jgi:hypothetical protein
MPGELTATTATSPDQRHTSAVDAAAMFPELGVCYT